MSEMSEVKPSGVEKFLTYAIVAASSGVMLYICYRSFIMLGFWALLKTLGVTFIAIGLLKPVLWRQSGLEILSNPTSISRMASGMHSINAFFGWLAHSSVRFQFIHYLQFCS